MFRATPYNELNQYYLFQTSSYSYWKLLALPGRDKLPDAT